MKRIFLILIVSALTIIGCYAKSLTPQLKQSEENSLWGFTDPATGNWLVKPVYTDAKPFKMGADGKFRALVQKNGKQGFLGENGKPLGAGVKFDKIESLKQGNNMFVWVNGKQGIIDLDGRYIIKPDISYVEPIEAEGYIVTVKDKKGLVSPEGNIIIKPDYSVIDLSLDGYFIVQKKGKIGLFSRSGECLIDAKKYTGIEPNGDYWFIRDKNKIGLYDPATNNVLVKPDYSQIGEPTVIENNILIPVRNFKNEWGAVGPSQKEVIKCDYKNLSVLPALKAILVREGDDGHKLWFPKNKVFLELEKWDETKSGPFKNVKAKIAVPESPTGLAAINSKSNYINQLNEYKSLPSHEFSLVIDADGQKVGDIGSVKLQNFGKQWLVAPRENACWSLYDADGRFIKTTSLTGEKFTTTKDGSWIASGNRILTADGEEGDYVSCGDKLQFMRNTLNNQWSPIVNGHILKDSQTFSDIKPEGPNTASVCNNNKWGMFSDGKLRIDCTLPTPLRNSKFKGFFETGSPGTLGLLSNSGRILLEPKYSSFDKTSNPDVIAVTSSDKMGLYNLQKNSWLIPIDRNYTDVEYIDKDKNNSQIWIYRGDLGGVADTDGKEIIPPIYNEINRLNRHNIFDCQKGNNHQYFTLSGERYTPEQSGKLSDFSRKNDNYIRDKKGETQWFDINTGFLKGHKVKVVGQLLNADGTPHKGRDGKGVKFEQVWNVDKVDFHVDNQMFHIPYDDIIQQKKSSANYIMQYILIDLTTNKTLDEKKINFSVNKR